MDNKTVVARVPGFVTTSVKFRNPKFREAVKEVIVDSQSSYQWEGDILNITSPLKFFVKYF